MRARGAGERCPAGTGPPQGPFRLGVGIRGIPEAGAGQTEGDPLTRSLRVDTVGASLTGAPALIVNRLAVNLNPVSWRSRGFRQRVI